MAVHKLTTSLLKRIIAEERAKLQEEKGLGPMGDVEDAAKETEEVDADELGTDKVHAKDIDHLKALKIKEAAFMQALEMLREAKAKKVKAKAKKEAAKKKAAKAKAKAKPKSEAKKKSVTMTESQLVEELARVKARRAELKQRIVEAL